MPNRTARTGVAYLFGFSTLVVVALIASASASATRTAQRLSIYSITSQEQFLNHADDRQRGTGNNPFGNFKAPTATTKEHNAGPFPADQAVYGFKLYRDQARKTRLGSATFICTYNFNRNGHCDASWRFKDGTLVGAGQIDFDSKTFTLVVTGGTGEYHGASGSVTSTPVPGYAIVRLAVNLN